jgi:hypothetical protein
MGRASFSRPLSPAAFEATLREEISIAREYELPLTLLVASVEDGWSEEETRRALDVLRGAEPVARLSLSELALVLINTTPAAAGPVTRRLRQVVPEASVGMAALGPAGTCDELLRRARQASAS